jgi:hypothetical protein
MQKLKQFLYELVSEGMWCISTRKQLNIEQKTIVEYVTCNPVQEEKFRRYNATIHGRHTLPVFLTS